MIIDKLDFINNLSNEALILFWNNNEQIKYNKNWFSIINIIEENADTLKSTYLNWINDIGEIKINGVPIYQKLRIRNIYSYWWQTIFIEKSNYEKESQIDDSIKLIALQEWLKSKNIKEIKLISNNKKLGICLKDFSKKQHIDFSVILENDIFRTNLFFKSFKNIIPSRIVAFIWLIRKIKYAFPFLGVGLEEYKNCNPDIIFVDYLINLDEKSILKEEFQSNYWGSLINKINERELNTLWIHIPVNFEKNLTFLKSAKNLKKKLNSFHINSNKLQTHIILDNLINFDILIKSFFDLLKILKIKKEINLESKIPFIEKLNLWPLYKKEWNESFYGTKGISNCLNFNLFNRAFKLQKRDSKLIYLLENHTWEFSMIEAWKNKHQGEIIGYIHSCVPYWDMRKYFDEKTLSNPFFPSPDKYGLNGDLSKKNFEFNKIKNNKILKLEATRYLYLNKKIKNQTKTKGTNNFKNEKKVLLVICDYTNSYTEKQLKFLSDIKVNLNSQFKIIIKPHPAKVKNFIKKYKNKFIITNEPIAKLAEDVDVILTSNTTTAALEFYHLSKPIILILDNKALNLSPLRNMNNVKFVSNSHQLLDILNNHKYRILNFMKINNLFYLNDELDNWLDILENKV